MHQKGLINPDDKKAISRHEIKCTLEDVISTASGLLRHNGRFFMVHRPIRLVDIMFYCRQYKLEPKYLRFIHPAYDKKPNLLLLECVKAARPELKILDPLYVYNKEGEYTDEVFTHTAKHIWRKRMNFMNKGKLYVCPTPIGNLEDITIRVLNTLKNVDLIAAEDTRHTLKLLNYFGIQKPLTSYHEHNFRTKGMILINKLLEGQNIALVSDAGMPGISDQDRIW